MGRDETTTKHMQEGKRESQHQDTAGENAKGSDEAAQRHEDADRSSASAKRSSSKDEHSEAKGSDAEQGKGQDKSPKDSEVKNEQSQSKGSDTEKDQGQPEHAKGYVETAIDKIKGAANVAAEAVGLKHHSDSAATAEGKDEPRESKQGGADQATLGGKVQETVHAAAEKLDDANKDAGRAVADVKEGDAKGALSHAAEAAREYAHAAADVVLGTARDVAEVVGLVHERKEGDAAQDTTGDEAEEAKDAAKDTAARARDTIADKAGEVRDAAAEKAGQAKDAAKSKAADAGEAIANKAGDAKEAASEKAGQAKEAAKSKAADAGEAIANKAGDAKEAAAEKADNAKEAAKSTAADVASAKSQDVSEASHVDDRHKGAKKGKAANSEEADRDSNRARASGAAA